jgi:polyisoprenoid-binding protein YceI
MTSTAIAGNRTTWTIDPAHSTVEFVAKHMMITTVKGRFAEFEGTIVADEEHLADSSVEVTMQAASLDTRSEQRDAHLRSPDFLDVETYPEMVFISTAVEQLDDDLYSVTGDLTIKDVTRPVTVDFTLTGSALDPFGNMRVGFEGAVAILRSEWGLTWNAALETGGWLVSDRIQIEFDVSAIRNA